MIFHLHTDLRHGIDALEIGALEIGALEIGVVDFIRHSVLSQQNIHHNLVFTQYSPML